MSTPYSPSVAQLLTLGEIEMGQSGPEKWRDYRELGIRPEHGPELARFLADPKVHRADVPPRMWAVVHAWRAAGSLRAAEAVEPLIGLLRREDEEWVQTEIPVVLGMIGPPAVPELRPALAKAAREKISWDAIFLTLAFKEVAERHPEARDEVVETLAGQLRQHASQDGTVNGELVASLLDLDAVEAAPEMEEAFAAGSVDLSIAGDWEEVQVKMGLIPERTTPRPESWFPATGFPPRPSAGPESDVADAEPPAERPDAKAREKAARKRKAQKAARKKNRKR